MNQRRPAAESVVVAVLAIGFALAFGHALLAHFGEPHDSESLFDDWDLYTALHWIPWVEVTRDHQLPLWDPYRCSGIPLLGYAEARFLSPLFALSLAFGPFAGMDLEIFVHLAIAWAGGWFLGRTLGLGPLACAASASVFPASSWLNLHVAQGHLSLLPYAYAPWVLACGLVAVERRRFWAAAIGGALLALVLGEGGIAHVFVYVVPLVGVVALVTSIAERDWWPLVSAATTVAFGVVLGAVKLVPMLAYAGSRPVEDHDALGLVMLGKMFFARDQDMLRRLAGAQWGYWEYGAYVGLPFAILALVGVIVSWRRALPWLVTAVVMLGLAVGDHGPYAPWSLLHHLPVFDSLRVPSRWIVLVVLAAAPLVGFGMQRLADGGALRKTLAVVVLALALVDTWMVSSPNLAHVPVGPSVVLPPADRFRQWWDPSDRTVLRLARANLGALNCENEIVADRHGVARGRNQPGYRGEEYLDGAGTVTVARWTANVLEYDVAAPAPTTLIVNQRWDRGWHLDRGTGEVVDAGGLLAVRVDAGTQRLRLRYGRATLLRGAAMSGLGVIALAVIMWRRW